MMTAQELAQKILEAIEQTEQKIHQGIQMLDQNDHARAYHGMNMLTVLKNDIKELCQEEVNKL